MAKEVMNETVATVDFDPNKVYAQLTIKDGVYIITDETHGEQECGFDKSGDWVLLPENDSNRKAYAKSKLDKFFAENEVLDVYYKPTRTIGSTGTKLPNAKLISYLSEEDQAEYAAIIQRAKDAKAADKKVPASKIEALKAKIEKLQAQYDALNNEEA